MKRVLTTRTPATYLVLRLIHEQLHGRGVDQADGGPGLNQPVLGKPLSSPAKTEKHALWIDTTNKASFELGDGTNSKTLLSNQVLDTNWHYVAATQVQRGGAAPLSHL